MTQPTATAKRPGRPKIHTDAAERQRAYRARLKKAGKPADARQSTIASLRDEIARLTAGQSSLDAQRKLLEARSAALEDRIAAVAEREAALAQIRTKPGDERKLLDLEYKVATFERERQQWKFKQSDKLRELLGKRFMMPKRQLSAVFLVSYSGKPIEQGYEFERATKEALEFGRKAATAGGAIAEIAGRLERHQQLNADERAILDAARNILGDIHNRATIIKEGAKSDTQRIKREEAARRKAAEDAVAAAFPRLEADAVPLGIFVDGSPYGGCGYRIKEIRGMRPETVSAWDIKYCLEDLAKEVRDELTQRVDKAIKAGEKAGAAAQALLAAFEAARPGIEVENKTMLDNLNTCRVAARLKEANKPRGGN
jgi:hypothetical protein